MSKAKPGTVKETGAKAGDVLIGIEGSNRNLQIRIHRNQEAGDGGRVKGSFDLLDAGDGAYAEYLSKFIGESFLAASELIESVAGKSGAQKCTHVVNLNMMKVLKAVTAIADTTLGETR